MVDSNKSGVLPAGARRQLLVLTACGLLAAGCGGGGNNDSSAGGAALGDHAAAQALPTAKLPKTSHAGAKATAKAVHGRQGHTRSATHGSRTAKHAARRPAKHTTRGHVRTPAATRTPTPPAHTLKKLSPAQRVKLVAQVARAMMATLGVRNPTVKVGTGGRSVAIDVPTSAVCKLPPDATSRIVDGVKRSASFVRSVTVTAGGSSLASYTSSNCQAVKPPVGTGERVYAKVGAGFADSTPIKITGRRWTLTYASYASFFSVQVEKDGQYTSDFAYADSPGSGKQVFDDGPGTFVLHMAGAAWNVQVYDG